MAIDTAERRRSAAGVAFLPLTPGVTPNAAKDQEWRQQAGWSYSGILAGNNDIPTDTTFRKFVRRRHTRLRARKPTA